MKKLLLFLCLIVSLNAKVSKISDELKSFSLPDQFDKVHQILSSTKYLIVTSEKGTSAMVNEFINSKEDDFLEKNSIQYIADISAMPSIITKLFALPKMRDYKYKVLLIYDEKSDIFQTKDEKITIYEIEDMVIKNIIFVSSVDELNNIFK